MNTTSESAERVNDSSFENEPVSLIIFTYTLSSPQSTDTQRHAFVYVTQQSLPKMANTIPAIIETTKHYQKEKFLLLLCFC